MMRNSSEKPVVFSALFQTRYDASTGKIQDIPVTQEEVQETILQLRGELGISLKAGNPANFLKDYLRSPSRNKNWPDEIAAARYTARQVYGKGNVFEFVPYQVGQTAPFPTEFILPPDAPVQRIETVSLPSAARALGRGDEPWLIQVCVNRRLIHTHFSLFSDMHAEDLFHLQNSIKGTPEIDAVFLLVVKEGGRLRKAIVTLEAKRNEPILPDQIKSQAAFMAKQTQARPALGDVEFVVPMAVTATSHGGQRVIALFEMGPITVAEGVAAHDGQAAHMLPITISKAVAYTLHPPVAGI